MVERRSAQNFVERHFGTPGGLISLVGEFVPKLTVTKQAVCQGKNCNAAKHAAPNIPKASATRTLRARDLPRRKAIAVQSATNPTMLTAEVAVGRCAVTTAYHGYSN